MLIAGVGNIFLGDDGFGCEVARKLAALELPGWVRVGDWGIRGLHLAYELLDGGYEPVLILDATPRGGVPGTVYLIEPDLSGGPADGRTGGETRNSEPDAHGMNPMAVFSLLRSLGGTPGRVLVVGCEPADTEEGIGLSPPVAAAVDEAVRLVLELVEREAGARLDPVHLSGEGH